MNKTSIRYFLEKPLRGIWDEKNQEWRYSATDLVGILAESKQPRIHWHAIKNRNPQLKNFVVTFKLRAGDGKFYASDTLSEAGIRELTFILPSKNRSALQTWLRGLGDPLDEQSKKKAYELFDSNIVEQNEVGRWVGLQKIHGYLFDGLYDFAGKMRTKTISKGGYTFANADYLINTLRTIDKMREENFEDIIAKYLEMNIAHPFYEGNGRATRIWLDMLLKKVLKSAVDWSLIDKQEYLQAMKKSPADDTFIYTLIKGALTTDVLNRELFLKGIDYSYYYEQEEG